MRIVLLLALALVGCSDSPIGVAPQYTGSWQETMSAPLPERPQFIPREPSGVAPKLDELERIAKQSNVRSIKEFLDLLPPEMMHSYVLLENSRSEQGASRQFPRVILFTEFYATLTFAFNGHLSQAGYSQLEAMEFISPAEGFELRRFLFPENGPGELSVERNPAECRRCHGANPRPIWEPMDRWTGAIGSDYFLTSTDRAYFQEFVASGAANPRYSRLNRQKYFSQIENGRISNNAPYLEYALARNRIENIIHGLMNSPDYEKFKFAIFGAIAMCPSIENFLPVDLPWANAVRLNDFRIGMHQEFAGIEYQHRSWMSWRVDDAGFAIGGRLRWILESRGIFFENWGNSLQNPYLFDTNMNVWRNMVTELSDADPELQFDFSFLYQVMGDRLRYQQYSVSHPELVPKYEELCHDLRQRSRERLSAYQLTSLSR